MVNIDSWLNIFLDALNERFKDRIWFVGLQGSYARGEATVSSDIDVVVILSELRADDINEYNEMLDTLPHRELTCGFLSGKEEILNWEPSDLFQFYFDTKPINGSLEELRTLLDENAVNRAIKIGSCNIYHGCVHNMLHEKSVEILRALYKSASFVVQAVYYSQSGNYISRLEDLLKVCSPDDKPVIETFISMKNSNKADFQEVSERLFNWSKRWILI